MRLFLQQVFFNHYRFQLGHGKISLDFITGLPRSQGNDAILVVIDRFTKYAHFLRLRHLYTAKAVAELFAKEIIRLHGMPKSIVKQSRYHFSQLFFGLNCFAFKGLS